MAASGIRRCRPGDAAALALVSGATFLETYAWMIAGKDLLAHVGDKLSEAAYEAHLADPACALWMAEGERGAPVGYALLTPPDLPIETGATDIELRRIYLLTRYQGGGMGNALFAAAVSEARVRGMTRLLIGVAKTNTAAIGFYRRHGCAAIGERIFRVGGEDFEDAIFARAL
ncbi:GNAT family N-acetyltransferase [Sphingomonas flavalba]|uniref:GNAT family N-acetyltransferase n=1 Tax=Sphingomonas flavalba TaxID=2559804 RepID=UPI00109DF311|nr:GNAT family N-acetyltransferase [Sphingomonas flavalba]